MREILFRGKRVDNGEWVKGWYFQKQNPFTEDGDPVRHCISDLPPFGHEVIQETVGQFTGQTDKNGEKIFEGDIVKAVNMGKPMVISYQSGSFGLCREDTYYADLGEYEKRQIQVIGNIYDDQEIISPGRY